MSRWLAGTLQYREVLYVHILCIQWKSICWSPHIKGEEVCFSNEIGILIHGMRLGARVPPYDQLIFP